MPQEIDLELARYRELKSYRPQVGDVVIKHGWLSRTKWFGIVNYIDKDGNLTIVRAGLPRLLVTMAPDKMKKETTILNINSIRNSVTGSYTVFQSEVPKNVVVWYV